MASQIVGSRINAEPNFTVARDLCLLSLDGGGIRGISSLLLLKKLMESIDPKDPPRPCDYFDLIGGTSTGGLIALMLGRLRLTVDDCIEAYSGLSPKIFSKIHHRINLMNGETQGRFNHEALESGIKDLLRKYQLNPESLLKDSDEQHSCKVFVCATSQRTGRPVILSSYQNERRDRDSFDKIKIWEAARATSAATTFFEPITVGNETYVDGATGANNPINYLCTEAGDIWGNGEGLAMSEIKCLVSLGTGVPALIAFEPSISGVAKALKAIATDTEETADLFQKQHTKLFQDKKAFRFNVVKGLENVGLEEIKKWDEIKAVTSNYIQTEDTRVKILQCAFNLQQRAWIEELSNHIQNVAQCSVEALHDREGIIPPNDLLWLTHTNVYEKWRIGKAPSSCLWYQQQHDYRSLNLDYVAASILHSRPFNPHDDEDLEEDDTPNRALYFQCLTESTFPSSDAMVHPHDILLSLICQMMLLDCSDSSTLNRRILSLSLNERETLREAFQGHQAKSFGIMLDFLVATLAFTSLPSCIGIDNIHLLGDADQEDFLSSLRTRFDVQFQTAKQKIPIVMSGLPSRRLVTRLSEVLIIDNTTEYTECVRSLYFAEWNMRRTHVDAPAEGTNEWIWQHSQYQKWEKAALGILWVEGKPGSGKSVLARSLQARLSDTHGHGLLRAGSGLSVHNQPDKSSRLIQARIPEAAVADWFYSTRLGSIGTSNLSFMRSIVYQLLDGDRRLFDFAVKYYRRYPPFSPPDANSGSNPSQWCNGTEFEDTASQILERVSASGKSVICIVDAVDEAKCLDLDRHNDRHRATTILRFLSALLQKYKYSKMKFIVLGRPDPYLELDFFSVQSKIVDTYKIVLERENQGDIELVIEKGLHRLKRTIHAHDSGGESESESPTLATRNKLNKTRGLGTILKSMATSEIDAIERIRKYVSDNAQGVFLWVALILSDLEEQAYHGMPPYYLEARLKSLPLQLNGLYERIVRDAFGNLSKEETYRNRTILMLIDGSGALSRPLSIRELWEALAVPTDCEEALRSDSDPIVSARTPIRSWTGFRRQLRRKCGPLVEVVRAAQEEVGIDDDDEIGPQDIVQFIHRTVKDFFEVGNNSCGVSFTEEEAKEEVRALARRYSAIAFPKVKTKYQPEFRALPDSSWRKNVDIFVDYLDLRILLPFVVDILTRYQPSLLHKHLGIDASVLDLLFWHKNITSSFDDGYEIDEFMAELPYYPWCTDGIYYTVKSVRAALLGYATYYACSHGLATGAENLTIFFWDQQFMYKARYVMLNSALRASIENAMTAEVKILTRNGRQHGYSTIPRERQRIAAFDPFVVLAQRTRCDELVKHLSRQAEEFCSKQNRKYSLMVTTEDIVDTLDNQSVDSISVQQPIGHHSKLSIATLDSEKAQHLSGPNPEVGNFQHISHDVDSDIHDAVRAILRRWGSIELIESMPDSSDLGGNSHISSPLSSMDLANVTAQHAKTASATLQLKNSPAIPSLHPIAISSESFTHGANQANQSQLLVESPATTWLPASEDNRDDNEASQGQQLLSDKRSVKSSQSRVSYIRTKANKTKDSIRGLFGKIHKKQNRTIS